MQGPEDAPSGRSGGSVGRLYMKGGLGTAGELFKKIRGRGMVRDDLHFIKKTLAQFRRYIRKRVGEKM